MTRPSLAGRMIYRGQVLDGVTAQAPAILTSEQLDAVRAVFADPTRCKARRQPLRGLLDRVALCGACGEPVRVRLNVSRPRNDGTRRQFRTYACPAKPEPGHCFVVTHLVDALVVPEVINALVRIARHPRRGDFDLAASHAHRMELSHVREREQRITDAIADGLLTHAMAIRTLRRIRGDRDRILTALTYRDNPRDDGANGIEDLQFDEGEEPYTVAERFLRRLPHAFPRYWPIVFSTDPQLRALAVRQDIEDDFADLPLLVQQAVIRSTVRVVINPSTTPDTEARVRVTPL